VKLSAAAGWVSDNSVTKRGSYEITGSSS